MSEYNCTDDTIRQCNSLSIMKFLLIDILTILCYFEEKYVFRRNENMSQHIDSSKSLNRKTVFIDGSIQDVQKIMSVIDKL